MTNYDIARICPNGHLIGFELVDLGRPRLREFGDNYCEKCGCKTITECPSCHTAIRGRPRISWMAADALTSYDVPAFCRACGKPYPWMEKKIAVTKERIEQLDELAEAEKAALTADLPDLIRDTARTEVAAMRFKKLAAKVGGGMASALRDIVVDVLSEAAKKIILGP